MRHDVFPSVRGSVHPSDSIHPIRRVRIPTEVYRYGVVLYEVCNDNKYYKKYYTYTVTPDILPSTPHSQPYLLTSFHPSIPVLYII